MVDFVCYEKRLVIEVDGGQHASQQEYDAERTRWLESQGFVVMRFWDSAVLKDIEAVMQEILKRLEECSLVSPHPHLLPIGEGTTSSPFGREPVLERSEGIEVR